MKRQSSEFFRDGEHPQLVLTKDGANQLSADRVGSIEQAIIAVLP